MINEISACESDMNFIVRYYMCLCVCDHVLPYNFTNTPQIAIIVGDSWTLGPVGEYRISI